MSDPSTPAWRSQVALRESAKARHVRLRIDRRGRVELVVPCGFNPRGVDEILQRHTPWIEKTLHRLGPAVGLVQRPARIELPALGQCWCVEVAGQGGLRQATDRLLLPEGDEWPPLLRRWLARQGRKHLVPWLERVSEQTGLGFGKVSIRGQRTRWGSCSAQGNINLNYALLLLAPEQVDYLMVHELCHTVHLNHSPAFWRLVERHCPDYRRHDRALRGAMMTMPTWLHD